MQRPKNVSQMVALIGGTRERTNDLILPEAFSPEGTVNMRMLNVGALRMVDGYTAVDTDLRTDTGNDFASFIGITEYVSGATTKLVGVVYTPNDQVISPELEIIVSTNDGATWTLLEDLGIAWPGPYPCFAQHGNNLIITLGGTVVPRVYDGSTSSAAGLTQPTTPTTADNGDGNLNGTYYYKVAVIDSSGGIGPASIQSAERTITDGQITVTFTAAGGSNNGVRIFRTLGDGKRFFRVADVDSNAATTFDDNVSDRDLLRNPAEVENPGDAPPTGAELCASHRDRVFYANTSSFPNRLWWSGLGQPEAVGTNDWIDVGPQDGDEIRALAPEYNGNLIIFKERSIWLLSGDGPATFNLTRTAASVGCNGVNAWERVPANSMFQDAFGNAIGIGRAVLCYSAPNGTIRIFDGDSDTIVSHAVQNSFDTNFSYASRDADLLVYWPDYEWIVIRSTAGSFDCGWDLRHGTWHPLNFFPEFLVATAHRTTSGVSHLVAGGKDWSLGGNGASTFRLFTGSSANGSNITTKVFTKGLDFGVPLNSKMLQAVHVFAEAESASLALTCKVYRGWATTSDTAFMSTTVDLNVSNKRTVNLQFEPKSSGAYPIDEAFTYEFTIAGKTIWELRGFGHRAVLLPDALSRVS